MDDFRYLKEESNFLTPYSTVNPIEDFAETLSLYAMGKVYGDYNRVEVYSDDLTRSPPEDRLYNFSVGELIDDSGDHRDKVCQYVETVLGQDCR